MGRGSAWVARADNPMAAFFNPAAMAFQATGVHLGAQLLFSEKCYTRTTLDASGNQVAVPPMGSDSLIPGPLLPGQAGPASPAKYPLATTCAQAKGFPNPQLGAVFRITNNVAIGLALVAPHSAGKATWGQDPASGSTAVRGESLGYTNSFGFAATMPSPQRYMLVSSDALIINPTVSVAYAPLENLSFGVGFVWGIATADFVNFAEAVSPKPAVGTWGDTSKYDVRAEFKTKDLFIPGFILSALWSPTSNFDVAGWFKWQDALKGTGDVVLESMYWKTNGNRNDTYCTDNKLKSGCNITDTSKLADKTPAGALKLNIPMEAKLGFRFHLPRADQSNKPGWGNVPGRKVRDPMSEDWFDAEVDFTWANNSAVKDLELTFKEGIAMQDGSPKGIGQIPPNANIPHHWKDVFGVRVGGDFVVIPNRLTLRTGGFYEMKGQDDKYLALDFDLAWKAGVSGGATVRVGPVDISVGYAHTFYGTLDNGGKGSVYALSGDAAGPRAADPKNGTKGDAPCADFPDTKAGQSCFRSWQSVNGGKLTSVLNEFGISASARF
jgi:long-chain fatty acid transport protein